MKTYFVISDCHSFLLPLINSLNSTGFDINNDDHILIVLGDIFDRGDETLGLYKFFMNVPKNRIVFIRGNHEGLYESLLEKDFPDFYDFNNGTVKTFCAIVEETELQRDDLLFYGYEFCYKRWRSIIKKVKSHKITKFVKSKIWLNYYELNNFIFTHSFLPLTYKHKEDVELYSSIHDAPYKALTLDPNWRNNTNKESWDHARWGCPYVLYDKKFFKKEEKDNKILVCGHWHTSDFHDRYEKDYTREDGVYVSQKGNYQIYFGKNLIAIDGCIAKTHMQNVLVIKDNICFDQNLRPLNNLSI